MQGCVNVPTDRIPAQSQPTSMIVADIAAESRLVCWLLFEWNIQQHHFLPWKNIHLNIISHYYISASCSVTSGADSSVLWALWDHLVSL